MRNEIYRPLNVPAVDLAQAYFGSSYHADVQFGFINVNLVEAKNRFPIFSSSRDLGICLPPARQRLTRRTVSPVPKENVMRGRMMMVLASAALAGSLLATDAQAHGAGGYGGGGDGFPGNHLSGGFDGGAGDGNRGSGLRDGFRRYGRRDVWGHWGAYYGPMIPTL
jgi:hypothetical protein